MPIPISAPTTNQEKAQPLSEDALIDHTDLAVAHQLHKAHANIVVMKGHRLRQKLGRVFNRFYEHLKTIRDSTTCPVY